MSDDKNSSKKGDSSLLKTLASYTGAITSNLVDVVKTGTAIPLMYTDSWMKDFLMKTIDPERLQAMVDAGRLLKDAREVAGLNLMELSEALGLKDEELLKEVEAGRATLPFDMILRIASLIARHDPIPFIIKFLRTYNPALEQKLDSWGVTKLPKQYERERRFINLLRKHDSLRSMDDIEFERFVGYQEEAVRYAITIMNSEKTANKSTDEQGRED
jgi:transcriptional regulator with XRE-family HTH domain